MSMVRCSLHGGVSSSDAFRNFLERINGRKHGRSTIMFSIHLLTYHAHLSMLVLKACLGVSRVTLDFLLFPLKHPVTVGRLSLIFLSSLPAMVILASLASLSCASIPSPFYLHHLDPFFNVGKFRNYDPLSHFVEILILAFVHVGFPWSSFNWTNTIIHYCCQ